MGDDSENITDLKNRIKELNKKVNDIDSYFKNLFNNTGQDIGELKRKVKEKIIIKKKKKTLIQILMIMKFNIMEMMMMMMKMN